MDTVVGMMLDDAGMIMLNDAGILILYREYSSWENYVVFYYLDIMSQRRIQTGQTSKMDD